jgi:hypothetical protein
MPAPAYVNFVETAHSFASPCLFRHLRDELTFRSRFTYGGQIAARQQLTFDVNLKIQGGVTTDSYPAMDVQIRHTDYGVGELSGTIPFVVPGVDVSTFTLEIDLKTSSGAPYDGPMPVRLCLGQHQHPLSKPEQLLSLWIKKACLLRLPREWPLVAVSDGFHTNVVPSPRLLVADPSAPTGDRSVAESEEIATRVAALAALKLRGEAPDAAISVWNPSASNNSPSEAALSRVEERWHAGTHRIAAMLEEIHGIERQQGAPHDDDVFGFAFFQSRDFTRWVQRSEGRGLVVFGFSDADDSHASIVPVIDLCALDSRTVSRFQLEAISGTADRVSYLDEALGELQKIAQIDDSGAMPQTNWRKSQQELAGRVDAATRSGLFLNSEPGIVRHWLDLKQLGLTFNWADEGDKGRPEPWLIHAALDVATSILSRTAGDAPRVVVGLLNSDLAEVGKGNYLLRSMTSESNVTIGNIHFFTGQPTLLDEDDDCAKVLCGSSRCHVVLLSPIDSYTHELESAIRWLTREGNDVVGIVPLVSAAKTRPLSAAWDADYFPIVRLAKGGCVFNPRLAWELAL